MRFIAMLVIMFFGASTVFAQEATAWRKVADTIPLGTKVKISTFEGRRITGTLMRVDDTSVLVKKNTRRPEPAVVIPYDGISNLERATKDGFNLGKALAIGAATGAGFFLSLFAIAVQLD
jgi:hypothetical protein